MYQEHVTDEKIKTLFAKVEQLERQYADHFKCDFPERIEGWWDPLHIFDYPEVLEEAVKEMARDVQQAIDTNTPFEEIPDENWDLMIF